MSLAVIIKKAAAGAIKELYGIDPAADSITLNQTKPGAAPGFFGVFSWSAARLFVEKASALGGKLTRASLVDAIAKTDNWTGEGIHSPQHVGPRRTGDCFRFIQLDGSTWKPLGDRKYQCHGTTMG